MDENVIEVGLPNGAVALVRVANDEVGLTEKTTSLGGFDFEDIGKTLEGIAEALKTALDKVAPDKTTVQLGLEVAVKNGRLTGLLVEGEGKGSLAVTLEWAR